MAPTLVAAAAETTRTLPFDPIVFGLLAFGLLMLLMLVLLMFGKGRPHS
jgi:hypothetical protein